MPVIALAKHALSSNLVLLLYPHHLLTLKTNCAEQSFVWKGSFLREVLSYQNWWTFRLSLDSLTIKDFDFTQRFSFIQSSLCSQCRHGFFPLVVTLFFNYQCQNRFPLQLYHQNYQSPYEHLPKGNLDSQVRAPLVVNISYPMLPDLRL